MTLNRLASITGLIALLLILGTPGTALADKPAAFTKSAGMQIIAAARSRNYESLTEVVRRYSDLPDIGLHSLGSYRNQLPSSHRTSYYEGVARFMARYFIEQAQNFPVANFRVYTQSTKVSWGYEVDSIVTLRSGELHRLRWHVVPRRGGFKIRDVSIVGIWITPISMVSQQKDLFTGYIRDKGSVKALLSALGG